MKNRLIFFMTFFVFIASVAVAYAEENLKITTYYPSPEGEYKELKTAENTALAVSGGYVGIGKSTASPATQSAKLDVAGDAAANDVYLAAPRNGSPRWASETSNAAPDCEICIKCTDANGHGGAISCTNFNSGRWAMSRGESSDHGRGAECHTRVNCPPIPSFGTKVK